MTTHCILLVLLLFATIIDTDTARILAVFPVPSISHQVVFRPLTQELARRGHEIVVITPDPAFPKGQTPENFTEIDVHDLSYSQWKNFLEVIGEQSNNWLNQYELVYKFFTNIFEEQMNTESVQRVLENQSNYFDLVFVEACVRVAVGLAHVFKVPIIQISSLGSPLNNYDIIGSPSHPTLYPFANIIRDRIYNLSTWDKLTQIMKDFQYVRMLKNLEIHENEVLRRIFKADVPPLSDFYGNVEMLFLNVHPIWENNRPVPSNVVFMGGLHQKPVKELPVDLKNYLDSSKKGVIYISFGTNVKPSHLSLEKIDIITKVFSRLPYDILWKWDDDELPGRSENIRISKWLPQSDLLRHPKIKLFITQGGLQSTDEAITTGVPLIGIPILCDQWYNVEKYVYHRIGVKLDIKELSEEKFENAIKTVIEDKSYRQNIIELRDVMQDQPQQPLERAVWWTEYVLRHGGAKHLRSPAANISWAEYLEIELVFTLVFIMLLSITLLYITVKMLWKFIKIDINLSYKSKKETGLNLFKHGKLNETQFM